jgi:hypothetical protein
LSDLDLVRDVLDPELNKNGNLIILLIYDSLNKVSFKSMFKKTLLWNKSSVSDPNPEGLKRAKGRKNATKGR